MNMNMNMNTIRNRYNDGMKNNNTV